jgi:glutamine synthetase
MKYSANEIIQYVQEEDIKFIRLSFCDVFGHQKNRAKWILINELSMSEPEAHRYIEKQAMDRCISKDQIAKEIINTYS